MKETFEKIKRCFDNTESIKGAPTLIIRQKSMSQHDRSLDKFRDTAIAETFNIFSYIERFYLTGFSSFKKFFSENNTN